MGDPDRTFRLASPEPQLMCKSDCHYSPVRGSGQPRGSLRFQPAVDDEEPRNSFDLSPRFGSVRRPVTQQQVDWSQVASGGGERFVALRRIPIEDGASLSPVMLQWEGKPRRQQFVAAATLWEVRNSPLTGGGSPMIKDDDGYESPLFLPIVDEEGTVVGYFAPRVAAKDLRRYRPDGGPINWRPHQESMAGGRMIIGPWDGEVIQYDRGPTFTDMYKTEARMGAISKDWGTDLGLDVVFDVNGFVQSNFESGSTGEVHLDELTPLELAMWTLTVVDLAGLAIPGLRLIGRVFKGLVVGAARRMATQSGLRRIRTLELEGLRPAAKSVGRAPSEELHGMLSLEHKIPVKVIDPEKLRQAAKSIRLDAPAKALHPGTPRQPDGWKPPTTLSDAEKPLARAPFTERGYFDTTTKPTYLVRAENLEAKTGGVWGDELFDTFEEAQKYTRERLILMGREVIKAKSSLPDVWVGGSIGNMAEVVRIYEVPRKTPFIRGVVNEQFEAGGLKYYPGGGPQVVLGIDVRKLREMGGFLVNKVK